MSWASRPALDAQPPDSGEPVTLQENNLMLLYFKHLRPPAPAKRPGKSGPSCYNANRKSSRKSTSAKRHKAIPLRRAGKKLGTTKVMTKVAKAGKPEVAHVSRGAVSPFVATYLCSSLRHVFAAWSKAPASRSSRAKTHESNEIAPGMWGVVTRVRPATSTQTIENKRTILRHRPRTPRKTEISPYMRHSATFYKETLYLKSGTPCCFNGFLKSRESAPSDRHD